MKYCPKNKKHKNPPEALFCAECGTKLEEIADEKVCLKCRAANPPEAIFCQNCGAELPDEHGNVELTVRSGVVCEKISTSNNTQTFTSTNVCKMKVPGGKPTVIVLQYKGNLFYKAVNPQGNYTLNVSWGKVSLLCHDTCQVTIKGANIKVPQHFIGHQDINLLYGNYEVTFELDGKSETKELVVGAEPRTLVSGLKKYFTLSISSDTPISIININTFNKKDHTENTEIKRENTAIASTSYNLQEGSYFIRLEVKQRYEDHEITGQYDEQIDIFEDKNIQLRWCRFTLKSNALSGNIVYRAPHYKVTYFSLLPTCFLCIGKEYTLELTKLHGQQHVEKIHILNNTSIILERYWKTITLKFDRISHRDYPCMFDFDKMTCQSIPQSGEVVLEDVMYGEHHVSYYIDSDKYVKENSRITVTSSSSDVIHCRVNTSYTYKQKWMWLRRLVLLIVYLVNILLYSGVIVFLSLCAYTEFQENRVDSKGWILGLLAILSGIPLYLLFNRNGDDDHFYFSYKIPFWGLSGFCLAATSISFISELFDKNFSKACRFMGELYNEYGGHYFLGALAIYGFAWLFSNYVITRKIKGFTIKETLPL